MEEIVLYVNGESILVRFMKIDVGYNKNCVILFINLFEVVEKWNNDFGFNIMCKMFSEGYIVYVFSIVFSDFGEEYINLVC